MIDSCFKTGHKISIPERWLEEANSLLLLLATISIKEKSNRIQILSTYNFNSTNSMLTPLRFQVLFHSFFKVLFIFPSRYLFAIGLLNIFSLR